ncbi:uncharacterized protein BDZ99DRAFT_575487 [Mytilinidion resinicola]|uniref:Uncharacterized protein n=1 Tax=Mytilinidion resinicola TaxID=574789 RepID=A0A6A6Y660_9PEZI|nr:uncharacterized protein BDZ99DRAFT_575487 [Mytilinidion resinicola]KAF2804170.1 hypothetical protein BDZ99DRAFT_575487 [Mytilinidion resinicola]
MHVEALNAAIPPYHTSKAPTTPLYHDPTSRDAKRRQRSKMCLLERYDPIVPNRPKENASTLIASITNDFIRYNAKRLTDEQGLLHEIPKHTPTNPKCIKKIGKHNSPPLEIPAPDASIQEVRLFIHMVLTLEEYKIYKDHPEFIVYTVYSWHEMASLSRT